MLSFRHNVMLKDPDDIIGPKEFQEMVAKRAYDLAEKRGFSPGHELDDWLQAEREISNQCRYWRQEYQ